MAVLDANATVANLTSVPSSATAVVLLPLNRDRKGFSIVNASTAILYISLGSVIPTTALYTAALAASDGSYTCPTDFVGVVNGIWASVNGQANITEFA